MAVSLIMDSPTCKENIGTISLTQTPSYTAHTTLTACHCLLVSVVRNIVGRESDQH